MDRLLKYLWIVPVFMFGTSFGVFLQERRQPGYEFVGTHENNEGSVRTAYRFKAPFIKDGQICTSSVGPEQIFVICQSRE